MGAAQRATQLVKKLGRAAHAAFYYVPGLHRPTQPLLILGHMRSGSTLLAHLLNSHSEVAGYGETHRSYQSPRDLWGLRAHIYVRQPTLRIRARYVSDKNVNGIFPVDPGAIGRSTTRVVCIVREPVPSLCSLLRILPDWSEAQALDHYLERMDLLQRTAEAVGRDRVFFLTHHQLINASGAALQGLTQFLGLATPLEETYERTPTTGQWGWGDTTERIWAGKIVRDYEKHENVLSAEVESEAREAYTRTVGFLSKEARHAEIPFVPPRAMRTSH